MKILESILHYFTKTIGNAPKWSAFNQLGKSRISKSTYIWIVTVPLLSKLICKIGPEIRIPIISQHAILTLGLPFSWKIFYFSSLAFGLATIIYSIKCPEIIRKYNRYSQFKEEGKGQRQIIDYLIQATIPHANGSMQIISFDEINKFVNLISDEPTSIKTLEDAYNMKIVGERIDYSFWYVRSRLELSGYWARISCGILYLIGFSLLLILLAQNTWYVLRVIF
jgi:hypothetical protein